MENISIELKNEHDAAWDFTVTVSDETSSTTHAATLDKDYWRELTDEHEPPADFVKRSFGFLLSREPKESILRKFNIRVIANYFPEYEEEIRRV